jgi:hypothetical protein
MYCTSVITLSADIQDVDLHSRLLTCWSPTRGITDERFNDFTRCHDALSYWAVLTQLSAVLAAGLSNHRAISFWHVIRLLLLFLHCVVQYIRGIQVDPSDQVLRPPINDLMCMAVSWIGVLLSSHEHTDTNIKTCWHFLAPLFASMLLLGTG